MNEYEKEEIPYEDVFIKSCGCGWTVGNRQEATGPLEGETWRCVLCGQVQ